MNKKDLSSYFDDKIYNILNSESLNKQSKKKEKDTKEKSETEKTQHDPNKSMNYSTNKKNVDESDYSKNIKDKDNKRTNEEIYSKGGAQNQ